MRWVLGRCQCDLEKVKTDRGMEIRQLHLQRLGCFRMQEAVAVPISAPQTRMIDGSHKQVLAHCALFIPWLGRLDHILVEISTHECIIQLP